LVAVLRDHKLIKLKIATAITVQDSNGILVVTEMIWERRINLTKPNIGVAQLKDISLLPEPIPKITNINEINQTR
jgi:hypothetical protein